jgi:hypothetical protein
VDKRLNRRCDAFSAQLLTLQKYSSAGLLTKDAAWRIAANIAKLPELLKRPQ